MGDEPEVFDDGTDLTRLASAHEFTETVLHDLSLSPTEEYLHFYNIMMMLFNDNQNLIDEFIVQQNPLVELSEHPIKSRPNKVVRETVYSRLRNEFAHNRRVSDLSETKSNMTKRVHELDILTKKAIELKAIP